MAFYTKYVGLTHPTLKKERNRVWKFFLKNKEKWTLVEPTNEVE